MSDTRQRHLAAVLLSVTGIFLAVFFSLINLGRGLPRVSLLETAAALIYVLNLVYVVRGRRVVGASILGISVTAALLLVVAREAGGHAFFWIHALPLLCFFLLGLRLGTVVNAALLVVYSAFLALVGVRFAGLPLVELDVLLSYGMVVVFAWVYEAEQERHVRALERQSMVDPLTGAFNRRKLHEDLEIEIERERRFGRGLSLILFDVDAYKSINDRHGHGVGDTVLRELAALVQSSIRRTDRLFRYGGDEFVVLAPETGASEALRVADKLRSLVERRDPSGGPPLTISVGLAQWEPGDRAETFLDRADRALYRAKRTGKNRVVAAPSALAPDPISALRSCGEAVTGSG